MRRGAPAPDPFADQPRTGGRDTLRKLLITALAAGTVGLGFAFTAGAGVASADPSCWSGGHSAGPLTVNGAQSGTGGYVQLCIEGTPGINGTGTAFGDAASRSGYIVADGNNSNPGASSGYLGVSSAENGIVGCSQGDFNNEAYGAQPSGDNNDPATTPEGAGDNDANNQILPLPTDPNFQADLQQDLATLQAQTGPCAVAPGA